MGQWPEHGMRLCLPWRKQVRSALVAEHVRAGHYDGAVVFSCGNASRALASTGTYVVRVAEGQDLRAERWWDAAEVHRCWPYLFDATSGHLPMPLMARLAEHIGGRLGGLEAGVYVVPTGSGETVLALRMAPLYRDCVFVAEYGPEPWCSEDRWAPLAPLVASGPIMYRKDGDAEDGAAVDLSALEGFPCRAQGRAQGTT